MTSKEPLARGRAKSDALAALRRWEASGATWIALPAVLGSAEVDLISCDGGEVMGRLVSSDPAFLSYVQAATATKSHP